MRFIDPEKVELKGIAVFDENLDILIPLSDVRKALQMTPTEDVEKVVRCKDCKNQSGIGCPFYDGINKTDTDFCSYGERKKYIIKMSNAYGNTAVHSIVDAKDQAEREVHRLITSQERYDNHYWWEEEK